MKIILVGSLPPVKDGVADHNMTLFESIVKQKRHEITIISDLNENIKPSFKNGIRYVFDIETIKNLDFDLVHLQFGNSYNNSFVFKIFNYFKKTNCTIISTLHDTILTNNAKIVRTLGSKPINLLYELERPSIQEILERSSTVIVYSKFLKDFFVNKYGNSNKFKIIFHGANENFLKVNKIQFKDSLGLNKNDFVVSSFGNVTPRKGYENVLMGLRDLKKQGIKFKYYIIGSFNYIHYKMYLYFYIMKLGLQENIVCTGYLPISQTKKILSISDTIIQPRLYSSEGASGSLMMALASGIPVITVNIGGFSEYIKNGETGFLIDHDYKNYSKAILSVYKNKNIGIKIGKNAKNWMRKNLNWKLIGLQHIRLYEDVYKKS